MRHYVNMKGGFAFLFCYALTNCLCAQTYLARNAMHTREVPVPKKVVRKFKRAYPRVQIDSCSVSGGIEERDEEYTFYCMQQSRVLDAAFNKYGDFIESKTEISIEELPVPLQQAIAQKSFTTDGIGKVFRLIGNQKKGVVEYMVECFTNYQGTQLKVPMYFNAAGYGANPGFR